MYSLVYKLFFFLRRRQRWIKEQGLSESVFIQKAIDYIEWFFNFVVVKWYYRFPSKIKGSHSFNDRIVVSLTSYPARINTVWITIETIMRQTVKPDTIILWLANEQFKGLSDLPPKLLELCDCGLTIRFCDDLKSHKKYFYTIQEYPDSLVILLDDDMFYPYDTIGQLLKLHKKYPKDICTITGQKMGTKNNSLPSEWVNPGLNERFISSKKLQIFSGSGSLYPPGCLHTDAYNKDLIRELCLSADDLWLTYMAHKAGTCVTCLYPWRPFPVTIYGTGKDSLWFQNSEQGMNDVQWKKINNYYAGK